MTVKVDDDLAPGEVRDGPVRVPRALRGRRTLSAKWRGAPPAVIPVDIADMDFPLDPVIRAAVRRAIREPLVYPPHYTANGTTEVLAAFYRQAYAMRVDPAEFWLVSSCVAASYLLLNDVLAPGDEAVYFAPSYEHIPRSITGAGGVPVPVDIHGYLDGAWSLLDRVVSGRTRVIYVCNPHNPTGRTFGAGALRHLAGLAAKWDILVVSNELHGRLVLTGRHIPFASLGEDARARTLTLSGPTKSHNMSGLGVAFALFARDGRWRDSPGRIGARMTMPKTVQQAALRAAYGTDSRWLRHTLVRLRANRDFAVAGLTAAGSGIAVHPPEATYFLWLDLGGRSFTEDAAERLERTCGVRLMSGRKFGAEGRRWARMSLATDRNLIREAVRRLAGG
ncbi:aminotransferase class I/II-fold pyridoxal phosphate-dependent enzyme [Amycolatopsis panacis]|nr:aminotransferase class I/II-fold pyridoxal phosphate-dependent enzyme [Amycolatopsis panacis]